MNERGKPEGLPWEEAAERRTDITGWVCKTCKAFYGDGPAAEEAARYCHAPDAPCKCGRRRNKSYVVCDECRDKRSTERYYALEEVDWDGTTPLADYDGDLFDVDDLAGYLDSFECGTESATDEENWESALHLGRFCLCEQKSPMHFDLGELLSRCDVDDDDAVLDADGLAAEKVVNDWLARFGPTWAPIHKRPSLASLRKHLGLPAAKRDRDDG